MISVGPPVSPGPLRNMRVARPGLKQHTVVSARGQLAGGVEAVAAALVGPGHRQLPPAFVVAERAVVLVAEIHVLGLRAGSARTGEGEVPQRMRSDVRLLPIRGVAAGTRAVEVAVDAAVGRKQNGTGIDRGARRKDDVARVVVRAVRSRWPTRRTRCTAAPRRGLPGSASCRCRGAG